VSSREIGNAGRGARIATDFDGMERTMSEYGMENRAVRFQMAGLGADNPSRAQRINEPLLAASLASSTLADIMARFGLTPQSLARLRERFDL